MVSNKPPYRSTSPSASSENITGKVHTMCRLGVKKSKAHHVSADAPTADPRTKVFFVD